MQTNKEAEKIKDPREVLTRLVWYLLDGIVFIEMADL